MHAHHPHGFIYIIYGIIMLCGGVYGYAKTNSLPSLIAGIVSAVLACIAAALFRYHPRLGALLGGLLGLALAIFFYVRYTKTQKAMPAIPIGGISLLVFFYSIFLLMRIHHLAHPH
jgi:uncharacterized membrane protein (UPF0136 family)